MKLEPDSYTAEGLIDLIESGRLAIPDFQRRFVWRPTQVTDLMVSISRQWPIGSLLLLEGPADFAVRALEGAPELSEARLLVLDGQQRITAIYQALGSRAADEIYVLDFAGLADAEELGDEHIKARRRSTFLRQYPDVQRRARAGLIPLEDVVDDAVFAEWVKHFDGVQDHDAFRLRKEELGGLLNYRVPAVRLERDIEMGALAKIFETINRTGERLRAFDLMVARLYPHHFNLAEEWKAAQEKRPIFERFNIDGLELLRLIALRENVRQFRNPDARVRVKGIRQGDVLGLEAETVRGAWEWAVTRYGEALRFVSERCGAIHHELLPSPTMLLPAAVGLDNDSPEADEAVERWWWAAALSQTYAQGANTQAVRDARDLEAELSDGAGPPGAVVRFEPDPEVLHDSRRRNETYLRALMCLTVITGARDWLSGTPLREIQEPMALHQVFPERWLEPRGVNADGLLNITVLPESSQEQLRIEEPHDLLELDGIDEEAVASHGLCVEAVRNNDWQSFASHRQRHLLQQLEELAVRSRSTLTPS